MINVGTLNSSCSAFDGFPSVGITSANNSITLDDIPIVCVGSEYAQACKEVINITIVEGQPVTSTSTVCVQPIQIEGQAVITIDDIAISFEGDETSHGAILINGSNKFVLGD